MRRNHTTRIGNRLDPYRITHLSHRIRGYTQIGGARPYSVPGPTTVAIHETPGMALARIKLRREESDRDYGRMSFAEWDAKWGPIYEALDD